MKSFVDEWTREYADKHNIFIIDQTEHKTCSTRNVIDPYTNKVTSVILLDTSIEEMSQAFAIAHEIGHIELHHPHAKGLEGDILESDADYFAVDLIYKHCKSINIKFNSVCDFLTKTGIPAEFFNLASVAMVKNLSLVMLLRSRKPDATWLFRNPSPNQRL